MIDKEDIVKMQVKPTKREDGLVYGVKNKKSDFTQLQNILIKNKEKSLIEVLEMYDETLRKLNESNLLLKEALLDIADRLEKAEMAITKYGLIV